MNAWKTVALGEATTMTGGGTPTRNNTDYYGGAIPWVTPKDMKSWEIHGAQVNITEAGLRSSAARLIPPNSVLIVVRSGVLKHTIPVALNRVPVAINQDMKALRCSGALDPDFLARFIKAQSPEILQWVRATTADNFPIDMLKQLRVPVPPLTEQRRIAEVLDRAEALRANRRAALAQLDTLAQSIFLDLFGDSATNPKGWEAKPLRELVTEFRYGTSNKSATLGQPALRIPNVVGGTIDISDLKLVPVEPAELDRLRLIKGNVLFVRTNGNPDFVGRCAVFDDSLTVNSGFSSDEFIFASYLIRARLRVRQVTPVFLREFMLGAEGRRQLRSRSKTSAGQFNINTENLGAISIPVPPQSLQEDFASRLGAVEKLKVGCRASLVELDALFSVLQHRAFRGEL